MTPAQKADLLLAEPGEVVTFSIGYPDSPKTYSYAAIRTRSGQWYVTGADSPQGYTWRQLIGWLESKGAIVHTFNTVTELETLL